MFLILSKVKFDFTSVFPNFTTSIRHSTVTLFYWTFIVTFFSNNTALDEMALRPKINY